MTPPLVSVVMTTYNSEHFLSQAIESILQQSFTRWELIVVDDGSTDSSVSIIRSFCAHDARIRCILLDSNAGISKALNCCLRAARGEYIARMDSDDISHQDRLLKQVLHMEKHPDIFLLGCKATNIDEFSFPLNNNNKFSISFSRGSHRIAHDIASGIYPLLHPTLMFRRSRLNSLGGYREIFRIGEDIDLYARLLDRYGAVFDNLPKRLYYYRRYKGSLTRQKKFSEHAWVQTLVMYSAHCRRSGLPDPLDKAKSLHLSSLPISSSQRRLLQAWHFFHRLYDLPKKKKERSRLLYRAEAILKKEFSREDLRSFPYPYLQLARASARSGDPLLFLRMLAQAMRSDGRRTSYFLLRKILFLLGELMKQVLTLKRRIFNISKDVIATSPRVSVVMTTYNRASYLSKAIESWQRQTFSNFELIVVDDGSTDNTKKILRNLANADHRIRLLFLSCNYGIPYAANRGLELVRAPLVARADSDDIALPIRLQRQVRYMDAHPHVAGVGSLCGKITEQGKRIKNSTLLRRGTAVGRAMKQGGSPLLHPTVMLRSSNLLREHYRECFTFIAEDIDLFLRMQENFSKTFFKRHETFDNIPEILDLRREHPSQITNIHREDMHRYHAYAFFSAHRRARGLVDPLSGKKNIDMESLQQTMTKKERDTFEVEVATRKLLAAMSNKTISSEKIVKHLRGLRARSVEKGRFVWLALSATQNQARRGFYIRSLCCFWEGLRCSPRWTVITLYDVLRTRRYEV